MTERKPWECPRCHRVLAPWVDSCDHGGGGSASVPAPAVGGGSGGTGVTVYAGEPGTSAGTAVWPALSTTLTGNTVTGRNAA